VGVAVPGIVEHRVDDARVHAPIIGWHDVPLERLVRERVGAPVFVENGAKALGQVEMWFGAGRGTHHTVITLWGTGVGAAIFTNGTLYRGAASSAGSGHNCIIAEEGAAAAEAPVSRGLHRGRAVARRLARGGPAGLPFQRP